VDSVTFTRECRLCHREKPITEFRVSTVKGARRRECKDCQRAGWAEYREKHRLDWEHVKKRRAAQERYRSRNLEKLREYQKDYQRQYRQRQKDLRHGKYVDDGTVSGGDL
jgi:hypothetical protein